MTGKILQLFISGQIGPVISCRDASELLILDILVLLFELPILLRVQWIVPLFFFPSCHILTELRPSCHRKGTIFVVVALPGERLSLYLSGVQLIDMESILVDIFRDVSRFAFPAEDGLGYLSLIVICYFLLVDLGRRLLVDLGRRLWNHSAVGLVLWWLCRTGADCLVVVDLRVLFWDLLDSPRKIAFR